MCPFRPPGPRLNWIKQEKLQDKLVSGGSNACQSWIFRTKSRRWYDTVPKIPDSNESFVSQEGQYVLTNSPENGTKLWTIDDQLPKWNQLRSHLGRAKPSIVLLFFKRSAQSQSHHRSFRLHHYLLHSADAMFVCPIFSLSRVVRQEITCFENQCTWIN